MVTANWNKIVVGIRELLQILYRSYADPHISTNYRYLFLNINSPMLPKSVCHITGGIWFHIKLKTKFFGLKETFELLYT
jgi:hypothetical protein